MEPITLSVVVPIYNEAKTLEALHERLVKVLVDLKNTYEVIYVDDGSTDNSFERLKTFQSANKNIKIVSLSRNFGHQTAVMAGLQYSRGNATMVMDADLQDPPEMISAMLKKWQEGFHVVYGIRKSRKESLIKRACYKLFYFILNKISSLPIPRDAGDFCLMDRRVVKELKQLLEERPFVRGLRTWVGFKQAGIEYDRPARKTGRPKYNVVRLFGLAFDGILSFSNVALRLAAFLGFIISFLSILYGLYIGINRILVAFEIIDYSRIIPGWATLVCSTMLLMGVQFIFLGILGEYIGRIFIQAKKRPLFIVSDEVGFEEKE